jgi:hypothetical protein
LTELTWFLTELTWFLTELTWFLPELTWFLTKLTWFLTELTWFLPELTWFLTELTWFLTELMAPELTQLKSLRFLCWVLSLVSMSGWRESRNTVLLSYAGIPPGTKMISSN